MRQSFLTLNFALSTAAAPLVARTTYPITADALNCRSGPSTSHGVKKTYYSGDELTLACQTPGQSIKGDSLWAKTSDGCYVADYYVSTGTSDYVVDKCGGGGSGGGGNSYPITADALNCRSGASTSHGVEKTYQSSEKVTLTCQTKGQSIKGDSLWGKTSDGCYVADYYVSTGTSDYVVDKCSDGGGGNSGGSGDNSYPITADALNCRSGASTSHGVEKTYQSGEQVTLTCQTTGESINGDNLWGKTSDGCYVADYYVNTGTSHYVVKKCSGGGGSSNGGDGGTSSIGGSISRDEIISRGEFWTSQHIPYSMHTWIPGPEGKSYRTDCSGFVSMALHLSNALSTVTLPNVVNPISWDDLQPGDVVGTLGPGTGGASGHVTLFHSWANSAKSRYHSLECQGGDIGCAPYEREINWPDHGFTAKPYRYIHVQ